MNTVDASMGPGPERTARYPQKAFAALLLGSAGCLSSFLSPTFDFPALSISLIWFHIFPLLAALAYGFRYGVLAGGITAAGLFFRPEDIPSNIFPAVCMLCLYGWHGYCTDRQRARPNGWNNPLLVQFPFTLVLVAAICLFASLESLPHSLPKTLLETTISMYGCTLIAAFLYVTPETRRLLGIPIVPASKYNGLILLVTLLVFLSIWALRQILDSLLVEADFLPNLWRIHTAYDAAVLIVVALASIGAGYLFALFTEKRFTAENASKQVQNELSALLELSPLPIAWSDDRGTILFVNRKFQELFGYSLQEIPTLDRWYEQAYPDPAYRASILPAWEAEVREAQITHQPISPVEVTVTGKDGNIHDVSVVCTVTRRKTMAIFTDLTERKRREDALQASETFLNAIIDVSPYPMWIADSAGRLIRINDACCRLLGIARQDVLDRYNVFEDMLVIQNGLVPLIRTTFEQGRVIRFDMQYEASHLKLQNSQPCPTVILDITMYPILRPDGTVKNVVVQHIDVTERIRAEEASRKSEARFRGMAEQLLDVLLQVDRDGFLTYLSPSVEHVFGWTVEEAYGRHFTEFVAEEDVERSVQVFQSVLDSGAPMKNLSLTLKRKDGNRFFGELNGTRILDGDSPAGALGIIRDVTERIEAQEARERLEEQLRQAQKMEAVGQLAGGIAHDFNNLLQVILGHLDLLLTEMEPGHPAVADLHEVHQAAQRAADLTRQLLAFSRRQVIQPVNLDVNELIHGLLNMLRRVIGEHIDLQFRPQSSAATILADRGQIEQVLINLCVNARDAMPSGGTLTIETKNVTLDEEFCAHELWASVGRHLMISVADTGYGMDEATQTQIFEPFFTTKEVGKGTGLGLATVYGIVQQHNGFIHVYSEPGQGAVFRIYLPAVESPAEEWSAQDDGPIRGGTETILVAEDEESVRTLVSRILERAGYTVLPAADGQDALRVFEANADTIDLALLDVIMPGLGGRDVMEKIKAKRPEMPFLFSSGYSRQALHKDFIIQKGLRLIQKPYQKNALLREIRHALDK